MSRWNQQSMHSDISSFSDNPKVKKQLRQRKIRRWVIAGLILLILGLGARPAYRAYRDHLINGNLEEARVAARLQDWPTARGKARSVLLARPGDYEAFRIWTIALGHIGEPRTYLAAAMMFTNPKASEDDQLEALRIMAKQAPEAVALSAYASLPEEIRDRQEFLTALAPLVTRRGGSEIVIGQLGKAEGSDSDARAQLELLRAYCAVPSEERVAKAREIFVGLIKRDFPVQALEALEILGETPGGLAPGEDLPRLSDWVEKQPEAETLHFLLSLHPSLAASPGAAGPVYEAAIARFGTVDPAVLGTWLIRQGEAKRALEMLKVPAETRADAYIAYLHALLRAERENELMEALAEPPPSADLVEVELVRAAMARRRGDQPAESAAWTRALNQAAFDGTRNRFLEVAQYATLLEAPDASVDAWVGAVRIGWGPIPLYADLQPEVAALGSMGRSEDLLAIFRTLLRFEPQNPDLRNNYYYLGLLHELVSPEAATSALEALLEEYPERTEFSSALALAYLEQDLPGKAIELMPTIRSSQRLAPMMADALEGTALVLSDLSQEGVELLERVNWSAFMRQEKMAFRRLLLRKEIAGLPLPVLEREEISSAPEAIPEWRKAVDKLEKARENDVLPALPAVALPEMPELPQPKNNGDR